MPIRSSVTVSLVPEAKGGPFVFWDDLPAACASAKALGFEAVEVFAPAADAPEVDGLPALLADHGLALAAVGTGAGWLLKRWTLTSPDRAVRERATEFIRSVIDLGAPLGAPAIVGSMQGRHGDGVDEETALGLLADALDDLGEYAARQGTRLVYEPLNRYETNLANTLGSGVDLLRRLSTHNVVLLADLFHMNIEEQDLAGALRDAGPHVGHVHLADSNRRPAGYGHTDFAPVAAALNEIDYAGFVSAEAFAYPDPEAAAAMTIAAFRRFFAAAG